MVQLWLGDVLNYVLCFFVKKHASFKWKDIISGFPVSPGSAEALVKWGGKIKYVLIAYFLGNIFAKNCCNRMVHVKIISSQRRDVFCSVVFCCYQQIYDIFNMSCLGVILQLRAMMAPQIRSTILALYKLVCMYVCLHRRMVWLHTLTHNLTYYIFAMVVSCCLPCSFRLPECPSPMVGPP